MPTKKTTHPAPGYICPVCHQEQAGTKDVEAWYVSSEAGDGFCCSEGCAGMLEAHMKMAPEKRQTLP